MWSSQLSGFSATVPRELVHRRSVSEVFLTGFESVGPDAFQVSVQWPRWHVFYRVADGTVDSALLVETMRQATILAAHAGYGVPLEHRFLMPTLSFDVPVGQQHHDLSVCPELILQLGVNRISPSGSRANAFEARGDLVLSGQTLAKATAGARTLDPATYGRVRGPVSQAMPRPRAAVSGSAVGVVNNRNVVLGESRSPGSWPLLIDQTHPILFDHPLDHVPGVLLIEAARQATRIASGSADSDITSFSGRFDKIVEFGDDPHVQVRLLTRGAGAIVTALLSIEAAGDRKAEFELAMAPGPRRR